MHSSAATLVENAEALLGERDVRGALAQLSLEKATGTDADRCSADCWTAHMLLGDFESAWRESDAIRRRGAPDPHRFWMGEDFRGKTVMLRSLHGFGDAVQMLRYAPHLRARAAKLVVEVDSHFVELARCFDGVDEVITWGEQAPASQPHWDVQVEVTELPYVFRTTLAELPVATRYLQSARAAEFELAVRAEGSLRIGLVWASGSWNPARSVPPELLCPLLEIPGCEFWNLQGGAPSCQARVLYDRPNVHTDLLSGDSLVHFAQLTSKMDLVITPDTLAAHLAGALGVPAWVMLQHAADWRWMLDREDSPWYPSLRLFRQPVAGDWTSVVGAVRQQLAQLSAREIQDQVVP